MLRIFRKFRPCPPEHPETFATREYMGNVEKMLNLIKETTHPNTFFSMYERALDMSCIMLDYRCDPDTRAKAEALYDELKNRRTQLIMDFLDRCHEQNAMRLLIDDIIYYRYAMPASCYNHFLQISGLNYKQYIYCTVDFGDGKLYYYICDFEEIYPGDLVVVPAGERNEEKLAHVHDVCICRYDTAPYPVRQTKHIISKIGE